MNYPQLQESVLVIDKTPGPSSFDIVRDVKRVARGQKVGHAGSLDPFASGVLVVLVGRATKLSNALLNADKSYRAVMKLGEATDTMDRTGSVIQTEPVASFTDAQIAETLKSFEGVWNQIPPMYSAKKIQGVRLYELARKNINVQRLPIPVHLYRVELVEWNPPYVTFEVECSKGTYIRSLADEIGRKLGTVAHLVELRRLSCGNFLLKESLSVTELAQDPSRYLKEGYRNYVKLLRAEGLVRQAPNVSRAASGTCLPNGPH